MKTTGPLSKLLNLFILTTFILAQIAVPAAQAQQLPAMMVNLPVGAMIKPTAAFQPVQILGVNIDPENPLRFNFIVDKGDSGLQGDAYKAETEKVIKYFISSLAMPENHMWVNLSPYEANRIIPQEFGRTEMGRDLLALDYMLKQLVSSLMYPKDELGEQFWTRVKEKAEAKFGTSDIPMNTFNKIWIVPETANIYEHANGVFITDSRLKVMLEEDYLALSANQNSIEHGLGQTTATELEPLTGVSAEVVREVLIPELEREVNEGEIFANLRQIYNTVILAGWYKEALKDSLLGQAFVDKYKTDGQKLDDPAVIQNIYERYVDAFKTGVYNYVEEEYDPSTQTTIPRKYFSGGADLDASSIRAIDPKFSDATARARNTDKFVVDFSAINEEGNFAINQTDAARLSIESVKRKMITSVDYRFTVSLGEASTRKYVVRKTTRGELSVKTPHFKTGNLVKIKMPEDDDFLLQLSRAVDTHVSSLGADASVLNFPNWIRQIVPEDFLNLDSKQVWGEPTETLQGVFLKPRDEFASFFLSDGPHTPIRQEFLDHLKQHISENGYTVEQRRDNLLEANKEGILLGVRGSLRLIDGANGTSHDLPEGQDQYVDGMVERLGRSIASFHELPATSYLSSAIKAVFRVKASDDPNAVEYYSPSKMRNILTLKEGDIPHFRHTNDQRFFGKGGQKYANAVFHVLHDIFGVTGVRVDMDAISAIAELGGMESSNAFMTAIVALGSILSGADLNLAEIYGLAVKLENYELGGLTGGQGNLAFITGGSSTITWTSGIKGVDGNFVNPYSAVVTKFLQGDRLEKFKQQAVLLQPGITYEDGEKIIPRTAGEINRLWMMLAELKHPEGMVWHLRTIDYKNMSEQSLRKGDYETAAYAHLLYVYARNMYVRITLEAALRGRDAINTNQAEQANSLDIEIANRLFFNDDAADQFEVIHQFLSDRVEVDGQRMDGLDYLARQETVLYLDDNVYPMWQEAAEAGIQILGLGAGGPGANFVAITDHERGKDYIKKWFRDNYDIGELDLERAGRIVIGEEDGRIAGIMDIETDDKPVEFFGFTMAGFNVPTMPEAQTITLEDVGVPMDADGLKGLHTLLDAFDQFRPTVDVDFEGQKYRVSKNQSWLDVKVREPSNDTQTQYTPTDMPDNREEFLMAVRRVVLTQRQGDASGLEEVGGIDLNRAIATTTVERDGVGFQVAPIDPAMFEAIEGASGLVPVIINVAPITNLPLLLGLGDGFPEDDRNRAERDIESFIDPLARLDI